MKKVLRLRSFLLLLSIALFTVFACSDDDEQALAEMIADEQLNIVQTAQNTDALSSLVAALTAADVNEDSDLIGTLSGEGPFTVLAPTNDAFDALLQSLEGFDSLEDFDTEEERALLGTILQYHVVAGSTLASTDLSDDQALTTVQGENVIVKKDGDDEIGRAHV